LRDHVPRTKAGRSVQGRKVMTLAGTAHGRRRRGGDPTMKRGTLWGGTQMTKGFSKNLRGKKWGRIWSEKGVAPHHGE